MKPQGRPTELTDLILDAKEAAEERLTMIHRSIFTGKPMQQGRRKPYEPLEESAFAEGPEAASPFPPEPGA